MPGFLYGYENFRKELESPIIKNKDEKAADRAHRIGQEKIVTVCRMIIKDTIEENLL